jgi:hypothetical protein
VENLLLHCLQPIREKLINQPRPKIHPKVLFLVKKISTFIESDKRVWEDFFCVWRVEGD